MPRILVIDDSATIRKVVEIAARDTDLDLRFAASGEDGVSSARRDPPDVILLDYVLPDLRGVDVCRRLAADPRTARVPVVMVTAKAPGVRRELAAFGQVVDFVAKPFDASELLRRACAAITDPRPPAAPPPRRHSAAACDQAARAMYARLRAGLALIPSVVAQLGKQPAAPFFARKLLTPSVVADLLDALEPILTRDAAAAPAPPAGASITGTVECADPLEYLRLLRFEGRTGELQLDEVTAYLRDGEVVFCGGRDPAPFEAAAAEELLGIAPEHVERARDEQRAGGAPVLVTLAGLGLLELPPAELAARLATVGRRLLDAVLARPRLCFAWIERLELPGFAAHSSASLGSDAAHADAAPNALRNADDGADADDADGLPPLAAIFDRVPGFSERVRAARLDAAARRLLTVVDGTSSLAELAGRSGVAAPRLLRLARDLAATGLIERRDERPDVSPVLIYEPDLEGFQRPLESLLRERPEARALVSLGLDGDVVATIRRERPCLVILSSAAGDERLRETAHAIREADGLSDLPLVAVLEAHAPHEDGGLTAAGFDAVLRKPVAYAEIERFIARKEPPERAR